MSKPNNEDRDNRVKWLPEEIKELLNCYANGGTSACPLSLKRHTRTATIARAHQLGLRTNTRNIFTAAEIADLKKNYLKGGPKSCAVARLRHSMPAIYAAAKRHGIITRTCPKWQKKEDDELRQNFPTLGVRGCPLSLCRHTPAATQERARTLGLTKKRIVGRSAPWWWPPMQRLRKWKDKLITVSAD